MKRRKSCLQLQLFVRPLCPVCGVRHWPEFPHAELSAVYRSHFLLAYGRLPTVADAVAHCHPAIRAAWEGKMKELFPGRWSEPPAGVEPVAEACCKTAARTN